jgi:hypothetical protein
MIKWVAIVVIGTAVVIVIVIASVTGSVAIVVSAVTVWIIAAA